jgi:asparagine synthase (glutamine-hydrolysing)
MCGIAGAVNLGDATVVARMVDAQRHRGPDDRGVEFFPEERTGLGHSRLAIIDLSPAGHQPMASEDGQLWIVFNGEIYNFRQLRAELEQKGHRFRSNTDTEVILCLYADAGIDCVRRLEGMFAFAIFDRRNRTLLLARDHIGIKPLYYLQEKGRFLFGSEIKSILASGAYSVDINWQAASDYFTYSCIPAPQTIFKGIEQVPAGHTLTLALDNHDAVLECYWRAGDAADAFPELPHAELQPELRRSLTRSVRAQMLSDVPLGIFLSGGVDSTILTGLAAEASRRPVKTFTVAFNKERFRYFDESIQARAVAQRFGTEHHEIVVNHDPWELLSLVDYFDQPFANPTAYLMYLISQETRRDITVALCGAGGDELFAGYPRYRAIAWARRLRWMPQPVFTAGSWALGLLADRNQTMTLRRAREFLDGLDPDFTRQFVNWTYYLNEPEKEQLLCRLVHEKHLLASERILRELLKRDRPRDPDNRVLAADLDTFLIDNLLQYTDRMSMAAGLEVRVPYLDREFIALSLSMPFASKLKGGRSKIILKEAFSDLLPANVVEAPKRGFVPPIGIWMRGPLNSYFDIYMDKNWTKREGIFNWEYIQSLRKKHLSGSADYSYELLSIIMFDAWFRRYVSHEQSVVAA